jgi:hypothetical protein
VIGSLGSAKFQEMEPLISDADRDARVLRLRFLSLTPQDELGAVFKFEAFYLSLQMYYLVLQNFHMFYLARGVVVHLFSLSHCCAQQHLDQVDYPVAMWSVCMISKRLVISTFALYSLKQYSRNQQQYLSQQRDTVFFVVLLGLTVTLFASLAMNAFHVIGQRLFPNAFLVLVLYVSSFI